MKRHVGMVSRLAGFDPLELHFARGYMVSSLISPPTNHRTDDYAATCTFGPGWG